MTASCRSKNTDKGLVRRTAWASACVALLFAGAPLVAQVPKPTAGSGTAMPAAAAAAAAPRPTDPIVPADYVIGSDDLLSIATEDGSVLWRVPLKGVPYAPVVSCGVVLVPSNLGTLTAYAAP